MTYVRNIFIDNKDGTSYLVTPSKKRILIDTEDIPRIDKASKAWNWYPKGGLRAVVQYNGFQINTGLKNLLLPNIKGRIKFNNGNIFDYRKSNLVHGMGPRTYFKNYKYKKITNNLYHMIWDQGIKILLDKNGYERASQLTWGLLTYGNCRIPRNMRHSCSLGQYILGDFSNKVFLKVDDGSNTLDFRKKNLVFSNNIEIKDGIVYIKFNNGQVGMLDEADYDKFEFVRISCNQFKTDHYFMHYSQVLPVKKTILLHRKILGVENTKDHIKHIDGNGLNCCRKNLKLYKK